MRVQCGSVRLYEGFIIASSMMSTHTFGLWVLSSVWLISIPLIPDSVYWHLFQFLTSRTYLVLILCIHCHFMTRWHESVFPVFRSVFPVFLPYQYPMGGLQYSGAHLWFYLPLCFFFFFLLEAYVSFPIQIGMRRENIIYCFWNLLFPLHSCALVVILTPLSICLARKICSY